MILKEDTLEEVKQTGNEMLSHDKISRSFESIDSPVDNISKVKSDEIVTQSSDVPQVFKGDFSVDKEAFEDNMSPIEISNLLANRTFVKKEEEFEKLEKIQNDQVVNDVDSELKKLLVATSEISTFLSRTNSEKKGVRLTEAEEDLLLIEEHSSENQKILFNQPACIVNGTLRPFQLEGVNWLYQLHQVEANGLLADEMGLGKTVQVIAFLGHLKLVEPDLGPHLIVCPRSTLDNWMNELSRWCPSLCVLKLWGNKEERDLMIHQFKGVPHDICLTTFEIVLREKGRLTQSSIRWGYVVIDEAHRIKNEKSMLAKVVRCIATPRRLLVTGTPLQNILRELWALLNFLMPKLFGDVERFERLFDISLMTILERDRVVKALHSILRPLMLRRLKVEVAGDLPPKKESYIFTGMSTLQKKIYSDLLAKNVDFLNCASVKSRFNLLNVLMQLRKCCNHPYLFDGVEKKDPETGDFVIGQHIVDASGKMVILDKLLVRLKCQGSRVLLFSQMTRMLDIIDDYCNWKKYSYCRIDGSTLGIDRQSQIDSFNDPNSTKFLFLLSTRAGGIGINLASADVVILYDSDFNPQLDLQAMDRAHRIGQTKSVRVFRLVTESSVEERIVERAAKRLKLDSLLIQGVAVKSRSETGTDEIQQMIRHGAQEIYSTQGFSSIEDLDIDVILEVAEKKSHEIQTTLETLEKKFDLNDLDINSIRLFEDVGKIDLSSSTLPNLTMFLDMGDRKTKWRSVEAPSRFSKKRKMDKELKGWRAEANGGYDFQFFNNRRLDELELLESSHRKKKMKDMKKILVEKNQLLKEGFRNWSSVDFHRLLRALREISFSDVRVLSEFIPGKTSEEIEEYLHILRRRHREISSVPGFAKKINKMAYKRHRQHQIQRIVLEFIRKRLDEKKLNICRANTMSEEFQELMNFKNHNNRQMAEGRFDQNQRRDRLGMIDNKSDETDHKIQDVIGSPSPKITKKRPRTEIGISPRTPMTLKAKKSANEEMKKEVKEILSEDHSTLPLFWNEYSVNFAKLLCEKFPKSQFGMTNLDGRLLFAMSCFGIESHDAIISMVRWSGKDRTFFESHSSFTESIEMRKSILIKFIVNSASYSSQKASPFNPFFR